jgi:sialidase-1
MDKPFINQSDLFIGGLDGYPVYRIPSLLLTNNHVLLAFCEARAGLDDTGHIGIALKRSFDNGITWEPMRIIADDGTGTIGNPCPLQDRDTGVLWLFLTRNPGDYNHSILDTPDHTRTVWYMTSEDDGVTWSEMVEVTDSTKDPNWSWYATGPGVGIQLSTGRLIIPCDHVVSSILKSHIIYSDDRGATWHIGGSLGEQTNECQVVELADGSLLISSRWHGEEGQRAFATSKDGGLTWSEVRLEPAIYEPTCQGSIIRYQYRNFLLFSNPACGYGDDRTDVKVRLSDDDGKTWPVGKTIEPGHSAYSCLCELSDNTIGCLYERGNLNPYEKITFAHFNLEWLTDDKDKINGRD